MRLLHILRTFVTLINKSYRYHYRYRYVQSVG